MDMDDDDASRGGEGDVDVDAMFTFFVGLLIWKWSKCKGTRALFSREPSARAKGARMMNRVLKEEGLGLGLVLGLIIIPPHPPIPRRRALRQETASLERRRPRAILPRPPSRIRLRRTTGGANVGVAVGEYVRVSTRSRS